MLKSETIKNLSLKIGKNSRREGELKVQIQYLRLSHSYIPPFGKAIHNDIMNNSSIIISPKSHFSTETGLNAWFYEIIKN